MQKEDLSDNLGTVCFIDKETDKNNLPDDKTPNPIYIPKHIQHRKKGRR